MSNNPESQILNPSDDAHVIASALLEVADAIRLFASYFAQDQIGDPQESSQYLDGSRAK